MEFLKKNEILEFHPNTLQTVRKLYDLDRPGRIDDAVIILEEWVKKQQHFKKKDFDKEYLERIIITMKGSLERSKLRLDRVCTFRTLLADFFGEYNVKTDFKELDVAKDAMLPKLTKDQYRVYFLKNNGQKFTSTFFTNFYRRMIIYCEYYNAHDYAAGTLAIFDFTDLNLVEYAMKLNPIELHQAMNLMIEGYGSRLKGIHIITTSKMVDGLVAIFKQVVSSKIAGRIHVHKYIETVYDYVEKDILPVEYGGKERGLNELHEKWLNVLSSESHMEYMKKMNAAGTEEELRSTDKFNDQYLGMPGTFRALKID